MKTLVTKDINFKKSFLLSSAVMIGASSLSLLANDDENIIVVTANRMEQNINDVLASVEVISREDIDRIQPESITDLLVTIAGLDIAFNGGAGQTSSLFTRGSNSDHTLILVDGIRVGSATDGTKALASIPVAQIERIEIVKGPRAALWGSDAIGGVIQIFSRRLDSGEYSIDLTAGSNNFTEGNLVLGFGSEKMKNTVTLSHTNSHGYDVLDDSMAATDFSPATGNSEPDDDGYRRLSLAFRGDYQLSDDLILDWVAQADKGNSEFDNAWGADETDYDNYFWNIRYSYTADKWLTQFSINQSRDESLSYTFDPVKNVPRENASIFSTTREQVNLFTQYQVSDFVSIAGGYEQYTDDISDSNNIISWLPGVGHDETKQTTKSIFTSSSFKSSSLIGEIALRQDKVKTFDANKTFNLSLGYRFLENYTLSFGRGKGYKAPTFNELYYPDVGYYVGNSMLVPEVSFNNELLFRGHWKNQSLVISSFKNDVKNLINYDSVLAQSVNIDNAELSGQELVYQYRSEKLTHKLSASYINAKDLSLDPVTELPKGTQLQRRAKEHFSYEFTADISDFSVFTQIAYTGKRPDKDYDVWPAADINLDSYLQVNLGASYRLGERWKFNVKINDLTDETPVSVLNYSSPGRQFFIGVQYLNF